VDLVYGLVVVASSGTAESDSHY